MRPSAAMAAIVVKAPMRKRPVGAPVHAGHVGCGDDIDQRSGRDAAAATFGEVGAGGAEFRISVAAVMVACVMRRPSLSARISGDRAGSESRSAGCRWRCR